MILILPNPVSNNAKAAAVGGRFISTKSAKQFKSDVGWLAKASKCKMLTGKVSVSIDYHPRENKDGSASEARLDIDNIPKVLFDALKGIAWIDDKQVTKLFIQIASPRPYGGLTVIIEGIS